MRDVLNTRELALLIWLGFAILLILLLPKAKDIRKSLNPLDKAFFAFKIQAVLLLMLIYIAIVVYFLHRVDIWDFSQLKNTLIWTCSVAFLSLFKIEAIKKDHRFFKHAVMDNLKLLTIIEFIVGFYTFSLIAELMIFPVMTIIVATATYAERDEKYIQVKNLLNGVLALIGIFLVGYVAYMLFTDFGGFVRKETFYDFITPPLLTLAYLPFIFLLMVYMSYETVNLRLRRFIKKPILRVFAKALALVVFHVRINLLERWASLLQFSNTDTYRGVWRSVKRMLEIQKTEKNPPKVDIKDGWSPYEAKEFLNQHGFKTGFYCQSFDYWVAHSQPIKMGDGIFYNQINYTVIGTEKTAKSLQLILTIEDKEQVLIAHEKLLESSKILFESATGLQLPNLLEHALLQGSKYEESIRFFEVCVAREEFQTKAFNGYDLTFKISSVS